MTKQEVHALCRFLDESGMYEDYSVPPDSLVGGVAQSLQCKSTEDGDGATGRKRSRKNAGRMPDPLQFAFEFGEVDHG